MKKEKKRMNPVLRKLHLEGKEIVTSFNIRKLCKRFGIDSKITIRNLMSRGHLIRIFRGIFYLKSFEEVKMGKMKYSPLELVSFGLLEMGVDRWYFCLNTALKLNNMTHEFFNIDHVASDIVFRNRPMDIAGRKFIFHRIKPDMFKFGIDMSRAPLRFSNPEKTILDFVYFWRYNGVPEKKIRMDISDYLEGRANNRLLSYLEHFPKSVGRTLEELI